MEYMVDHPTPRLRAVHRALADPLRIRLFELLAIRPRSARELAELIGRQPNRLYHHLAQLESGGLIQVTEYRRVPGGKVERVYAAAAVEPPGDSASPAEQLQFLSAVLEVTRADITAAREAGEAGERRNVELSRAVIQVSERRLAVLKAQVADFLHAAEEQPDEDGVWTTILWVAVDREHRPIPPAAPGRSSTGVIPKTLR
jgi:DNA-binding transcriptional ArsR family regulator